MVEEPSVTHIRGTTADAQVRLRIDFGFVYAGADGEVRLVANVGYARPKKNAVVEWRTVDPDLPHGRKAQGSATLASFQRWAVKLLRQATREDREAFEQLQWRRARKAADTRWMTAYRKKNPLPQRR